MCPGTGAIAITQVGGHVHSLGRVLRCVVLQGACATARVSPMILPMYTRRGVAASTLIEWGMTAGVGEPAG
jgi:hypothetical protein